MNPKRLFMMLALPLVLISQLALAQDRVVAGKVTDSKDGRAIAGASVLVKGTKTGTQTAADGTFKLSAPASANTLVVSYIGYTLQEVAIAKVINGSYFLRQ